MATLERTPRRRRRGPGHTVGRVAAYAGLTFLALIFLFPFFVMLRDAFSSSSEIGGLNWQWLPDALNWSAFQSLFTDPVAPVLHSLLNSLIISVATVIFTLLFASMAGFALARIPFRGANVVFWIILSAMMIPSATTFVLTYIVVGMLGGINTLWGIIVPGLFGVVSTFLFRQHALGFPREVEDAGRVDGLGWFGIYARLVLPNSKGMLAALGVLAFIGSWNGFLWPLVIAQSPSDWTIQVALSTFLTQQTPNFPEMFAGAIVAVLPIVVVFLLLQRYIVTGITLTGTKG
ncbi:MAG: carbohydrate ABC transporter permease [Candidatus Dormibacteraceae bacterium]